MSEPRILTFRFQGFTGKDWWCGLLPRGAQVRIVARSLVRPARGPGRPAGFYHAIDLAMQPLVVEMPWGSFRVLDRRGRVERWVHA